MAQHHDGPETALVADDDLSRVPCLLTINQTLCP